MTPLKETFKGCKIEISAEGDMTIDGKPIEYEFDSTGNKWSTRYLPYSQYDSLQDLAEAVVRDSEEFVSPPE